MSASARQVFEHWLYKEDVITLSPISGAPLLNPAQDLRQVQAPAPQQSEEASQLPAELPTDPPPSTIVDISDEGKRLLAARAVTESPVAVAALSDNPQVDAAAESVYMAQQAQQMLDIYSDISSNPPTNGIGNDDPERESARLLVIAAASENPQVDEFALTVATARQAKETLEIYRDVSQENQPGDI